MDRLMEGASRLIRGHARSKSVRRKYKSLSNSPQAQQKNNHYQQIRRTRPIFSLTEAGGQFIVEG
jgi:hypothetical protein